jgi:hypothetical protein
MLKKWLIQKKRQPLIYKFPVTDITELCIPQDGILDYLALAVLAAHGDPQQIRDDYKLLIEDAEDNSLTKLKGYLESHVLPGVKNVSVRVGNFGESMVVPFV